MRRGVTYDQPMLKNYLLVSNCHLPFALVCRIKQIQVDHKSPLFKKCWLMIYQVLISAETLLFAPNCGDLWSTFIWRSNQWKTYVNMLATCAFEKKSMREKERFLKGWVRKQKLRRIHGETMLSCSSLSWGGFPPTLFIRIYCLLFFSICFLLLSPPVSACLSVDVCCFCCNPQILAILFAWKSSLFCRLVVVANQPRNNPPQEETQGKGG